ncbi:MAG TPA: hypothetical protein VGP63_20565 [Planctomycetaceae bacterium]|jgi:hypothetical protein|nr:hypothetical protein [Planctomycetaceae bacterium]
MKCLFLSIAQWAPILFWCAIVILSLDSASAEEAPPQKDGKAILDKVVRAVASNRAQLKDVRAEILVVIENHRVDKPTKTVFRTKDASGTFYESPHEMSKETIAISGDQFRYDRTGRSEFAEVNPDVKWLIKPGEWQLYQAGPNWLKMWSRAEQIGRQYPIDPRDYGCNDMALGLQRWLESLKPRSAQLVPQQDGTILAQIQIGDREPRVDIECSSRDGFLPSLVATRYTEKNCASVEISYQPVLHRKAWFPRTMILRSFQNGAPNGLRSDDYQGAMKRFVTKVDVQSGDTPRPIRALDIPAGTQIQDMRDSSN